MSRIAHRTCHLCEAMCGLRLTVADGAVHEVEGDPDDPLSRGYLCPKAFALMDLQTDPDWLQRPVRRVGDGWQELEWDAAFDLVAARLRAIQDEHGNNAVAIYQGNPTVHSLGAMLYGPFFVKALRTRQRYSATSADQLPHHVVGWTMYGHQLLVPIPDVDRTDFLLMFGGNPAASNGSLMTAPDIKRRLKSIRGRGRVVLVDPRRTETAALAEHRFVRPGTDALLLAAMVRTILAEGWTRLDRLGPLLNGLDAVRAAVAPFAPDAVGVTGWTGEEIVALARDFASAERAVCHGRMGVSTQRFGGLCQWLVQVLNAITGNLDAPGGALFTSPALDPLPFLTPGSKGRWQSRVRGRPEVGGELPVSVLTEEITTPGEGRIRALVTSAGNPVLSTPGGAALDEALAGLDFMVSIDPYINETTRHADVILPPSRPLFREHYDAAFAALAVRNVARWSPPVFDKPEGHRHDWEIFLGLEARLARRSVAVRAERAFRRRLGPRGLVTIGLRTGPHAPPLWNPLGRGVTMGRLDAARSGIDLGPLEPQLPTRLRTSSGKVELAPPWMLADLPRLEAAMAEEPDGALLIGRRHLRSNNSWLHNAPRLMTGKPRCTVLVHPEDAEQWGLTDGSDATVSSAVGALTLPVAVDDSVMPGVVCIPHGFGHGRPGTRLSVANQHAGVSVNDLTDPSQLDELTGNAVLNGVPVSVAPA